MPRVGKLEFLNALLCEDIRQERNNKYIIIGVYSGDIILQKVPSTVLVSLFVEMKVSKAGQNTAKIRLAGPGEDSAVLDMAFETQQPNQVVTLAGPAMTVIMAKAGPFTVSASTDGRKWVPIIEKQVILASSQPSAIPSEMR